MHQIVAADVPQADRLTIRILAAVADKTRPVVTDNACRLRQREDARPIGQAQFLELQLEGVQKRRDSISPDAVPKLRERPRAENPGVAAIDW